ncbi:MAG TPA: MFS transporter [Candidatus Limnocylindrales bacterium]|jgi:MFS family permease
MRLRPYLLLLRGNRSFTRLYIAQLISFGGDWFATVALLGLALELTGSAALASLVLVLQSAPFFFASPIAGVLADRLDRRRLMVTADVLRAGAALTFLLVRDPSMLWIALLATAAISALSAFFEPTSSAALPNLVDESDLPVANVLLGSAWGTMLACGAALGGLVAVAFGRDAAFLMDAVSFAISAALIVGIRRSFGGASRQARSATPDPTPEPAHGVMAAIAEALALARRSRRVAAFLLAKSTFGVGSGVILLLAVFGSSIFQAGDVGIGILFAARGLGALLGPFLARAAFGFDDRGLIIGIGVAFFLFLGSYLLLPLAPGLAVAAGLVFVAHVGGGAQWTLSTTGLQRATPDAVRGRIFSVDYGLVTLVATISIIVAGAVTSAFGPAAAIYALAIPAAVASSVWVIWTRPLRRRDGSTLPE